MLVLTEGRYPSVLGHDQGQSWGCARTNLNVLEIWTTFHAVEVRVRLRVLQCKSYIVLLIHSILLRARPQVEAHGLLLGYC